MNIVVSSYKGQNLYSKLDGVFPPDLADYGGLGRLLFNDTVVFTRASEGGIFSYFEDKSKCVTLSVSDRDQKLSCTFELTHLKDNVSATDFFNDLALFDASFNIFSPTAKKIKIVRESIK